MKILNQIRYILFAIMILGCFASFAQNEYGLNMVYFCELFLGLIFLTEAFLYFRANYKTSKTKAVYLFSEHFLLGAILIGYFLFSKDIRMQGRLLSFFASFFLSIQYLIYAIRSLLKKTKKGALLSILVFLFIIIAIVSVNGLTWKLNHWPYSNVMMKYSVYAAMVIILIGFIKRKYSFDAQPVSFWEHLKNLPGKMRLSFTYFTIWTTYIMLIIWGLAPDFYSLSVPPAQEKMKQERNPAADIYWKNYSNFIDNRRLAEEK